MKFPVVKLHSSYFVMHSNLAKGLKGASLL